MRLQCCCRRSCTGTGCRRQKSCSPASTQPSGEPRRGRLPSHLRCVDQRLRGFGNSPASPQNGCASPSPLSTRTPEHACRGPCSPAGNRWPLGDCVQARGCRYRGTAGCVGTQPAHPHGARGQPAYHLSAARGGTVQPVQTRVDTPHHRGLDGRGLAQGRYGSRQSCTPWRPARRSSSDSRLRASVPGTLPRQSAAPGPAHARPGTTAPPYLPVPDGHGQRAAGQTLPGEAHAPSRR